MLLLLGYYEHLAASDINVPEVLTWICVFISLWYIPWNKKVEYYDNSIFNFFRKLPDFSTVALLFHILTAVRGFQYLHILSNSHYRSF